MSISMVYFTKCSFQIFIVSEKEIKYFFFLVNCETKMF